MTPKRGAKEHPRSPEGASRKLYRTWKRVATSSMSAGAKEWASHEEDCENRRPPP